MAGLAPFTTEENFVPVAELAPVLATSLGREPDKVEVLDEAGLIPDGVVLLSLAFAAELLAAAFEARKVLFTETALKVVGFLRSVEERG